MEHLGCRLLLFFSLLFARRYRETAAAANFAVSPPASKRARMEDIAANDDLLSDMLLE